MNNQAAATGTTTEGRRARMELLAIRVGDGPAPIGGRAEGRGTTS